MPWDDDRDQPLWDDYFLGPGRDNSEPPTTPGSDVPRSMPLVGPNGPLLPDITTLLGMDGPSGGDGGGWGGAPAFTGSSRISFDLGSAPRFTAPRFIAPTGESVLNEPGYKFGMEEGLRGLQQSAAGRGVLRTGGTLKDINAWGQNYAGQKYGDAFNRALSSFDREYQGSLDMYKPLLTEWQTNAAARQRAAELNFAREWDQYKFGVDDQFRREFGGLDLLRDVFGGF